MQLKSTTLHFAMAIFVALSAQSAVSAEQGQYTIKQSTPSVGTYFRLPIVVAGTIPLDERYAELTTEQKNTLKSIYEKMGDNDEPPFPLNGLRPLYSALGHVHEQLNLAYKGPVTMYAEVDSQGNAGALYLVEAPDPQIGQALANILALQKFKPALCNGTPCSMRYVFHAELVGPEEHNMKSANPASGIQINSAGSPH
jgi:hypothetical protein